MNLFPMLSARAEANHPIGVAQIRAGKFGTMCLSQARMTPELHTAGLTDFDPARARQRLKDAGRENERLAAGSVDDAFATGATFVTDDAESIVPDPRIDVIIEATGDPANGVRFARQAPLTASPSSWQTSRPTRSSARYSRVKPARPA
jgi:predicted homoserine dehydrogenase-like protein